MAAERLSPEMIEEIKRRHEEASDEHFELQNRLDEERTEKEFDAFAAAYDREECYLCGQPFRTVHANHPCAHWILRRGKFRKKDFPALFGRVGYTQIAAFARWCANKERLLRNINDLDDRADDRKLFEYTVRWKNIDWSFSCTRNDLEGHAGSKTDFPHFHFQMRIDGRQFINFNDFHVPFTEEDLLRIDLTEQLPEHFKGGFGFPGEGLNYASELDAESIVDETTVTDSEEDATFHMSTIISNGGKAVDPAVLLEIVQESQRTGRTIASLAKERFSADHSVKTIVSLADSVPAKASRTPRDRR